MTKKRLKIKTIVGGLLTAFIATGVIALTALPAYAQTEYGTVRNANASIPGAPDLRFTTYVKRTAESGLGDDVIITEAYSSAYTPGSGTHTVQTDNFAAAFWGTIVESTPASGDTYYINFTNITLTQSGSDSISLTTAGSQNMGQTTLAAGASPSWPTLNTPAQGDKEVILLWSNAGGGTTYRIYRKHPSVNGIFKRIAAGVTSPYIDTGSDISGGLVNETSYSYIIVADNGTAQSGHSNQVSATPIPTAATVPSLTGPSSGTAGQAITIVGSGFAATNTVYINGYLQTSVWN